jgi:hypothetical protein
MKIKNPVLLYINVSTSLTREVIFFMQHKSKLMNNNANCINGKKRTEVREKMLIPIYIFFRFKLTSSRINVLM